jgi:hypothetical protein
LTLGAKLANTDENPRGSTHDIAGEATYTAIEEIMMRSFCKYVKIMSILGVLVTPAVFSSSVNAQLQKSVVDNWMISLSNWQRWGAQDELGRPHG